MEDHYLRNELYALIKKDNRIFDFLESSSLDGLWYWDVENPANEWMSPRFWTVLGYDPAEMPHESGAWQKIIHPEDLKVALDNFNRHCANPDHPYDQVVRYKHRNGSTVWIRCRGMAIRDENGRAIRMLGAHNDVTAFKRAEGIITDAIERTEESEQKYRALYDNAPLSYQSLDEDGCFRDINPVWLKTLGYERHEVIGKWFGSFLHPDYVEHFRINFPAFKARGYVSDVQFKMRRKDGSYIHVSFEGCIGYTPEGKFKQTYCVFKDISDQKALEVDLIKSKAEIEESERNLAIVYNNTTDMLCLLKVEPDGSIRYVSVNKTYLMAGRAQKFDIAESDFVNREIATVLREVLHFDERTITEEVGLLKEVIATKAARNEVRPIETPVGPIYLETNLVPITNAENAVTHILWSSRNISDLKRVERDLILAKEKAEESDRLKTAFLQNMSHEIRTPMNAIMGFAELLPERFDDKESLAKYSRIIENRCEDLLDIINGILDISKIESGQSTVSLEEFSLNGFLDDLRVLLKEYRERIHKQHIGLVFPTEEQGAMRIRTDKGKLKQILINLVSNALKFTETGSVTVGVDAGDGKLTFQVRDTGVGIPEDKQQTIFERFSQLSQSSIHNPGGTGLGLPIVKGLVGLLGGEVWFESVPGTGTTFHFTVSTN